MQPYELSSAAWDQAGISQLRMRFDAFANLPLPETIDGYGLRSYRPGDEDAWVSVLCSGDFGVWDRARLDRMLNEERAPLPRESIWFATVDDHPAGVANAFVYEQNGVTCSELGWLAVDPNQRGHGLGKQVCLGVMNCAKQAGHRFVFLKTEDYRLPAIKTYLSLGFVPEMLDSSHPKRWRDLRSVLGLA